MIARNQRVRHLASCLPSPSITGGGQGLHGRLMLPIFARATGKRVWRNDMYRLEVWEPDAGEAEHGLRTEFADGIYIVTVHEDTPTDWLDLARRASVAAYEQHPGPNFMPASNYDSAIAVADRRVVGGTLVRLSGFIPRVEGKGLADNSFVLLPRTTIFLCRNYAFGCRFRSKRCEWCSHSA